MSGIVDFLNEYKDVSFEEMPFTEVDGLILSQFSYFRWDKTVPGLLDAAEGVTLADMCSNLDRDYVYLHEYYPQDNEAMLEAMLSGIRYRNMVCNYYSEDTSEEKAMQFAAMTCIPEGGIPVIVFRGTDSTLVGWKENFNMAFSRPVAGQRRAAIYLNQVALRLNGEIIVCGHSKGGNLATFAAMNAAADVKERIKAVGSYDGPGFRPEILEEYNYKEIEYRVYKLIPDASVVGVMLDGDAKLITIESEALTGPFQHNPFTWRVSGNKFIRSQGVKASSIMMHESLNEWVMGLNEEQLALFFDTLFEVLNASEADTIPDLAANWRTNLPAILNAVANVDKDTRKEAWEVVRAFIEALGESERSLRNKNKI